MGHPPTHERRPPPTSPLRCTTSKHQASPRTSLCRGRTSCFPCLFSLSKRVPEGTYPGSGQPEHLQGHLDRFVFRFNRCNSHTKSPLPFRLPEPAVAGPPAPYTSLAVIYASPKDAPRPATDTPHTAAHTRRTTTRPSLTKPTGRVIAAVTWTANTPKLFSTVLGSTAPTSYTKPGRQLYSGRCWNNGFRKSPGRLVP